MIARLLLKFSFFVVLAIPAGWASLAGADPVTNLYAADVLVHDQDADARASALKDALAQVLVKVTGSQQVLETSEAISLLENPAHYLQQYRYEAVQPVPADPEAARLVLHTEFDGAAIERRLRAAGLPLWGRERPLTLVWVAFSDESERRLVGRDPSMPLVDALQRTAARRALPLAIPEMDAEDATRVSFMDVWGIYEEPLIAAAARYAPDTMLVGSIFSAGNALWAGRWTLLSEGQRQQRWELSGASPEAVAVSAIDALAEYYGQEFAVLTALSGGSKVFVEIMDVEQLQAYAKVQSYLAGLSVVKNVNLQGVDDNRLRFELELNGTARALEQSIALGRVLEPLPPEEVVVRLGTAGIDTAEDVTKGQSSESGIDGVANDIDGDVASEKFITPQKPVLRYRYRS